MYIFIQSMIWIDIKKFDHFFRTYLILNYAH
mgnify:CR=1 FL=1